MEALRAGLWREVRQCERRCGKHFVAECQRSRNDFVLSLSQNLTDETLRRVRLLAVWRGILRFLRSMFRLFAMVANGIVCVCQRQSVPSMTRVATTTFLPQVQGLCSYRQQQVGNQESGSE